MFGRRRRLWGALVLLAGVLAGGACGSAPAAEPTDQEQTTSSVPLDIGEPAVLDRDDPNFTR